MPLPQKTERFSRASMAFPLSVGGPSGPMLFVTMRKDIGPEDPPTKNRIGGAGFDGCSTHCGSGLTSHSAVESSRPEKGLPPVAMLFQLFVGAASAAMLFVSSRKDIEPETATKPRERRIHRWWIRPTKARTFARVSIAPPPITASFSASSPRAHPPAPPCAPSCPGCRIPP
jgi:hypothetical protein